MAVSTLQDDKKKALNLAIAQIEKSCGKGSIMRLGADQKVRVEAISTGAINLDAAIGVGAGGCGAEQRPADAAAGDRNRRNDGVADEQGRVCGCFKCDQRPRRQDQTRGALSESSASVDSSGVSIPQRDDQSWVRKHCQFFSRTDSNSTSKYGKRTFNVLFFK